MLEFYPQITETSNRYEISNRALPAGSTMPLRQLNASNNDPPLKTESGSLHAICASCGRKIADRYLMQIADRSYHEDCVACSACGCILSQSCFTRDLKLYCKSDYERIFGIKCARCLEKISCSDLVLRVAGLIFHVECFACCMCGQTLPRGAHYVLRQGQPVCRRDYEHEFYLSSPQDDPGLSDRDHYEAP